MTPLIIAFISGIALGVLIMAFASANTLDHSSMKEDQLKQIVQAQDEEIRMYDEFVQSLKHSRSMDERDKKKEEFITFKN